MSHDIELVQIVLKVDGELCQVLLPDDGKNLLVGMLPGFFSDGVISAFKLPSDFKLEKLSNLKEPA